MKPLINPDPNRNSEFRKTKVLSVQNGNKRKLVPNSQSTKQNIFYYVKNKK